MKPVVRDISYAVADYFNLSRNSRQVRALEGIIGGIIREHAEREDSEEELESDSDSFINDEASEASDDESDPSSEVGDSDEEDENEEVISISSDASDASDASDEEEEIVVNVSSRLGSIGSLRKRKMVIESDDEE